MKRNPFDDVFRKIQQDFEDQLQEHIRTGPEFGYARPTSESQYFRSDSHRDQARSRAGQPTEFAPKYAELNPFGRTEIIHVITTLEA